MYLSENAREALERVVAKFESGDLSPIVEVVRLEGGDMPSSKWSFNNRLMVYIQTGGELDCRGYRQWQSVGRHVTKGSHAVYILVPLFYIAENEEGEKYQVLRGFKSVPVYPYSATDGKELPVVEYEPKELPPLMDVAKAWGISVTWAPVNNALGYITVDGSHIELGTHDYDTWFHELAHAAHSKLNGGLKGGQHADQETVAEFTACVLMWLYGFGDRTGNAWQYISGYNEDPLKAVMGAMADVGKVVALLEGKTDDNVTSEL